MTARSHWIYLFGPYRLDVGERRLTRDGVDVILPGNRIFDLLVEFVEHANETRSTKVLLNSVWDAAVHPASVAVTVNKLKAILKGESGYIETVVGQGYRFVAPVKREIIPPLIDELEPPIGGVPPGSRFYIVRPTDEEFCSAIERGDSIVLVKGPRQVGKTSLLARGLEHARAKAVAVKTDLQSLNEEVFENAQKLLFEVADVIGHKLGLAVKPRQTWEHDLGANTNFERYFCSEVLPSIPSSLVWGLDEVDRLFKYDYRNDIFSLFRTWHNNRALEPEGPWCRLTIAISYATEPHLFIPNLNLSPFNVGTRLTLEDFTIDEVTDLNDRYGTPLRDRTDLLRLYELTSGHPYLTRLGMYEMVRRQLDVEQIVANADRYDGVFGDHLRRLVLALQDDSNIYEALRSFICDQKRLTDEEFYRLRSAGVLIGNSSREARLRCELYSRYLKRSLCSDPQI